MGSRKFLTLLCISMGAIAMGAGVAWAGGDPVAAASGPKPLLISNCAKPKFKPANVILTCGDASFGATAMVWSSWTQKNAVGTGTGQVNDCTPNCASGKTKSAPIQLKPGAPRKCSNGRRIFTKVKFTWLKEVPQGQPVTGSIPLGCKLFNL
jgi:hypothetical protein